MSRTAESQKKLLVGNDELSQKIIFPANDDMFSQNSSMVERQLSKAATVQVAALDDLEDLGFLTQLASRSARFQHPAVREFMEEDDSDQSGEAAESAYRSAMEALESRLTDAEKKRIGPSCTLRDVLGVVSEARVLYCKSSKKRDKVEKMAKVLNYYSKSIDAACQHHPEYTSLVWGSMRFILQVSLSYFDILGGLATMLTEIGESLGRFDMYLQIYPTVRMKAICSKLYAAIAGFLKDAIVFFKKSRLRKYFSAFWSPFEVKFKGAIEEIQRLQRQVEHDAIAMGLMQLQLEHTALAERSLVLDHQIRFIIDFKNHEARLLISDLRSNLFTGHETDTTYHEDLVALYRTTSTPDWEYWFTEERKHVCWSHQPRSTLTYMQTDLVEPQIYCHWVAYGQSLSGRIPFAHLVWSPSMSAYSALASLTIQILQQRPDLLHRESRAFYIRKFNRSRSFDALWSVFRELLTALPGLLCYITIPSVGEEEETFARRIIALFEEEHGCPVNLQLVTPVHPRFPKPRGAIDIDAMYDVSPHMDSTDALLHVVLAEAGDTGLGGDVEMTMWQSLWRTVCYSVNAIAVECVRGAVGEEELREWMRTREGEGRVGAFLREGLETLVFALPGELRVRLGETVHAAIRKHVGVDEAKRYLLPKDMGLRRKMPNEMVCREKTWQEMKKILSSAPGDVLEGFFKSHLPGVLEEVGINDWVTVAEVVFSREEWEVASAEIGARFLRKIVVAIEAGLIRTVHLVLGTKSCGCIV